MKPCIFLNTENNQLVELEYKRLSQDEYFINSKYLCPVLNEVVETEFTSIKNIKKILRASRTGKLEYIGTVY